MELLKTLGSLFVGCVLPPLVVFVVFNILDRKESGREEEGR